MCAWKVRFMIIFFSIVFGFENLLVSFRLLSLN